jgi:hypothetical protein
MSQDLNPHSSHRLPSPTPLHAIVLERLRRALGEPNRAEGKDRHWSLRSFPSITAVNVLLDGGGEHPVVWTFNPHDPDNGVSRDHITHESEVDPLIMRIERAATSAPGGGRRGRTVLPHDPPLPRPTLEQHSTPQTEVGPVWRSGG